MEDWTTYCGNEFDEIIGVNVPQSDLKTWNANSYSEIIGESPIEVADNIALRDWSYSNNAVVAVIDEENEIPNIITNNKLKYTLPKSEVYKHPTINVKQTKKTHK